MVTVAPLHNNNAAAATSTAYAAAQSLHSPTSGKRRTTTSEHAPAMHALIVAPARHHTAATVTESLLEAVPEFGSAGADRVLSAAASAGHGSFRSKRLSPTAVAHGSQSDGTLPGVSPTRVRPAAAVDAKAAVTAAAVIDVGDGLSHSASSVSPGARGVFRPGHVREHTSVSSPRTRGGGGGASGEIGAVGGAVFRVPHVHTLPVRQ